MYQQNEENTLNKLRPTPQQYKIKSAFPKQIFRNSHINKKHV
jgi:hypothetical protein